MNKRRLLKRIAAAVTVIVVLAAGFAAYLMRDPLPHFLARRSSLANVAEGATTVENGYALTPVRLTAASGLVVDLVVRRALADSARRLPLAVILGGHRTGSNAASLVGDTPGVIVAALAYPYAGDHRPNPLQFVRDIPKIRGALLDTPPAVLVAIDYLARRPDVDTLQIEAVGVSLGAPFTAIAGALDDRISRVWVIHGTGGTYAPLEASLRRSIGFTPLRALAAGMAYVLVGGPRLDPVRWAPKIAPRPFVMVTASGDERLPKESVDALYASARHPKERIEMDGRHVRADAATIRLLAAIVVERMRWPVAGTP